MSIPGNDEREQISTQENNMNMSNVFAGAVVHEFEDGVPQSPSQYTIGELMSHAWLIGEGTTRAQSYVWLPVGLEEQQKNGLREQIELSTSNFGK